MVVRILKPFILSLFVLLCVGTLVYLAWLVRRTGPPPSDIRRTFTVEERVAQFGAAADARLQPFFQKAAVPYPPERLVMVGFKEEKRLDLLAPGPDGTMRWVRSYPILGASGSSGPKLREGDRQVPEGSYGIAWLNPNSAYHLSLRINYPNAADRAQAAEAGRTNLGGDIMIHGSDVSVGCLAMGDPAAEDLFVLAARTGIENIQVILVPLDLRHESLQPEEPWVQELYVALKAALRELPGKPE